LETLGFRKIGERGAVEFFCTFVAARDRQVGPVIKRSIAREI
jgi:hypothetical protein